MGAKTSESTIQLVVLADQHEGNGDRHHHDHRAPTEAAQEVPDAEVSAPHPTPFIFVKPYGVNHLMPALRPSAHQDELEHAALWFRDNHTNIDPVETETCDPEDPTLLVYGMLGDGNCYWHSWAFLLEIHSHPWRPRDDALVLEFIGDPDPPVLSGSTTSGDDKYRLVLLDHKVRFVDVHATFGSNSPLMQ